MSVLLTDRLSITQRSRWRLRGSEMSVGRPAPLGGRNRILTHKRSSSARRCYSGVLSSEGAQEN